MKEDALDVVEFTHLYREYSLPLVRYAARRTTDPQAAEDLVAETFALAWIKGRRGAIITRSWLYSTADFKLRDQLKRRIRQRAVETALARLCEEPPPEVHTADRLAVREALAVLTAREREAIVLIYWCGLDAADAALRLGCSTSAVWVALSRGRARLRTHFADSQASP